MRRGLQGIYGITGRRVTVEGGGGKGGGGLQEGGY